MIFVYLKNHHRFLSMTEKHYTNGRTLTISGIKKKSFFSSQKSWRDINNTWLRFSLPVKFIKPTLKAHKQIKLYLCTEWLLFDFIFKIYIREHIFMRVEKISLNSITRFRYSKSNFCLKYIYVVVCMNLTQLLNIVGRWQ